MNLLTLARYTLPILIVFALQDQYFLGKTYIFSPSKLQAISRASIAKYPDDTELLMRDIVASLQQEYGDAILPYNNQSWVLNNAGGAMVPPPSFGWASLRVRERCLYYMLR
jgi:C-8 sterol isomerase